MLTKKTRKALETMMVSSADAAEFEATLLVPAALKDDFKQRLEIAMADKESAAEVANALENGLASLSKRSSDALAAALASNEASLEMFSVA